VRRCGGRLAHRRAKGVRSQCRRSRTLVGGNTLTGTVPSDLNSVHTDSAPVDTDLAPVHTDFAPVSSIILFGGARVSV
jgi:hypothetical protein